ncbi:DNA topoisomerase 2-alpha-like isoform X2 [Mizuhopecten yessoensis]|uniref:DNA topoisomerase 2-alpha-like isoform X2 n=1 Tax=Mizuhopecten yessoensis TaxID=6573 RepID=UPI000B458189|nr:DNA topoisomerase 2-alpha-like isoform X2 [Mizuhopecten yessoensis]
MTPCLVTWVIPRNVIGRTPRVFSNLKPVRKHQTLAWNRGQIVERVVNKRFCQSGQRNFALLNGGRLITKNTMADGPLKTLFDNMNAKADKEKKTKSKGKSTKPQTMEFENTDIVHLPASGDAGEAKGSKKRVSIERIYQKKSQLEHILLRPDSYIGSTEPVTQSMWVYDDIQEKMVQREITFVPGLYKIFDEILVNASDNKQRDPNMNCIKIDIDPENNKIKIWNNGRGIPVVEHKTEKMYVATMIFGHLLTSSNYDDTEKKVTGGRNGYGAKLCNIFSTKFIVETSSKEYHKGFKQTWINNMGQTKEPTITEAKSDDFTAITFYPDLSKFKMETLDKDTVDLFTRRAYDIAAVSNGVKVWLNGKRLPVKNFQEYINLYVKDKMDENNMPIKVCYEKAHQRWEVAAMLSEKGFQQVSFVNSIATTKGGRHVDYITDQIVNKLIELVKKKNKGGVAIKPFQIKNHLWVFVNSMIENPTFDSQTKENMTLQVKAFGSKCSLSEKFATSVSKCGIVESIMSWVRFKAQAQLNKKCSGSKHSKLKGIPKLDDANEAGTRFSKDCTLILTEGDSAKTLAVAGLGVVGRDKFGVFPLKGKVLNVREATHKQIMENAEINNIIKIMGLQFKQNYDSEESLKTLRYGKLMIMTDQDQDGSHIKGLLINLMHHFWPALLKRNVVNQFITPIVKVSKGKDEHSFYSLPEFEEWKRDTDNWHTWKVKYYKGLGTSTAKEAKEYFSDMERHKIDFRYTGVEDDASITLAFSKKKVEERKEWLTTWMEERKRRAEMGLPELYLYGKQTKDITFNDFINRELILFSNADNNRSIPSMVDGFKPGQRKVIFTCFKRNLVKEIKVAQLAGSVGEQSAYHHGEASLMGTIVNLAQNFVGSNNINTLKPIGQFGTRLHGGKDAASPRYIFTQLSPMAKLAFNPKDEPLLEHLFDDNQKIEPFWYCPILPMVLVNGAEGIGTGWSTKVANYDPREIIANIKRLMDNDEPLPMIPSFKGFKGSIQELCTNRYLVSGEISVIDEQTVEITELPVRTWTQNYKEDVLEPMLYGNDKQPVMITDYKEYHTDTTVKFVVKMTAEKMAQAEDTGLHKVFKLQTNLSQNTMVLFDHNGCIKRYESVEEILKEFYALRLDFYQKRKDYMMGMLSAESLRFDNMARFILEKIDGTVVIENKPKKEVISTLVRRGYDSDPVKAWKAKQDMNKKDDDDSDDEDSDGPDFNYLLGMSLWSLSREKKEELLKQKEAKSKELSDLRHKTKTDLWKDDLEEFLTVLDEVEQQEKDDEVVGITKVTKTKGGSKPRIKKVAIIETQPSPMGRRVEPQIDSALKKVTKATNAKVKKLGKEAKMLDFKMEDGNDEPMSLADRLKAKEMGMPAGEGNEEKKKQQRPKKPKAEPGISKKSPKKSPKKGKKRNPWSDESEEEMSDVSDEDMDGSFRESVVSRDRAPRRTAATKPRYSYGSDEEAIKSDSDNEDFQPVGETSFQPDQIDDEPMSDEEDSFIGKPAKSKPAPPSKKAIVSSDEDDDDDKFNGDTNSMDIWGQSQSPKSDPVTIGNSDEEDMFKPIAPLKLKKTTATKAPAKKKTDKDAPPKEKKSRKPKTKKSTDSDDEDKTKKKTVNKRPAKFVDSDISEDEFVPKKKKATKKAAKSKKKAFSSDDDGSDVAGEVYVPRATTGRARATVKYTFDDDDNSDMD